MFGDNLGGAEEKLRAVDRAHLHGVALDKIARGSMHFCSTRSRLPSHNAGRVPGAGSRPAGHSTTLTSASGDPSLKTNPRPTSQA